MTKVSKPIQRMVNDRVEWAIESLRFMHKKRLKTLKISYFDNSTSAGWADFDKNELQFNSILLNENPSEFVRVIVPHEVVHFVDRWVYDPEVLHGKTFRRLLKVLNVPTSSYHNFDTDRCPMKDPDVFVYSCKCQHSPRNEVTKRTHKKREIKPVSCGLCKQKLIFSHIRELRKTS